MARFYFNIQDGETLLDDEGMELPDLDAVRHEAVQSSAEMLMTWKAGSSGPVNRGSSGSRTGRTGTAMLF
ncbi:MAG TPA: hypothetical protein VIU42_14050 [Xanthobacteraceae bacterium]